MRSRATILKGRLWEEMVCYILEQRSRRLRSTGTTNGVIDSTNLVLCIWELEWEGGLGSHEVCIMVEDDMCVFALKG